MFLKGRWGRLWSNKFEEMWDTIWCTKGRVQYLAAQVQTSVPFTRIVTLRKTLNFPISQFSYLKVETTTVSHSHEWKSNHKDTRKHLINVS